MMTEKAIRLRGIVPPMVTPLKNRDTLDAEGLERLIEHLIAGGVQGVFILGTIGEGPCLSYRLRRELVARTCRQVGSRLPVLVSVSDTSIVESLGLIRSAADAGASAVVLAAPYYYPLSQIELIEYVRHTAVESPLPLLLYNIPAMTKVSFEPETVRQLLDIPRVVGLKDSSRQIDYFLAVRQVTRQRPDWSLLVGYEQMLVDAIHAGGDGGVCAGANLFPRLLVELYRAAAGGLAQRIKCGLALRGICEDKMAQPFSQLAAEERGRVGAILKLECRDLAW
jgi:4-hydroxy-tetrahydrodipicolinate synthase